MLNRLERSRNTYAALTPHRSTHQQQGVRIHPLQAYVQLDGRMLDVRLTVREAKNGKFFYDLGEIEVGKKSPRLNRPGGLPHPEARAGERRRNLHNPGESFGRKVCTPVLTPHLQEKE